MLLVVPLCLLGFTVAWAGLTTLEVDDLTPEIGSVLNLEVFTPGAFAGQKCILLVGTGAGPTAGIPIGGQIYVIGEKTIKGAATHFQLPVPNNQGLVGTFLHFAAVTVNTAGFLTSKSNGVEVEIIDQEDIPG